MPDRLPGPSNSNASPDVFDMAHFSVPTPETRAAFGTTLERLRARGTTDHTRAVQVTYSTQNGAVNTMCKRIEETPPGGITAVHDVLLIAAIDTEAGKRYVLGKGRDALQGEERDAFDRLLEDMSPGLGPERSSWLRMVCTEAQAPDDMLGWAIDGIFDTSPEPVPEETHTPFQVVCNDGSLIKGSSSILNEAAAARYPGEHQLEALAFVGPDGSRYDYARYNNGEEELHIRKGTQLPRELDDIQPVAEKIGEGVSRTEIGSPEVMRGIQLAVAERHEARKLKLTEVTEAKLAELNLMIQGALASGIVEVA